MEIHQRRRIQVRAAQSVAVAIHHGLGHAFGADRRPDRRPEHVHRDRDVFDRGAETLQPLGRRADALVHRRLRARLLKAFPEHADLQALDAAAQRLGVFLDFRRLDARVVAVVASEHFEQQRIVGDTRRHRPGVVDEHLDRHDAGIGHEPPGRLHAVGAAERRRHADRAALVAADRHVDFAERDHDAAARGRAAGRIAHLVRIVDRARSRWYGCRRTCRRIRSAPCRRSRRRRRACA